MPILFPGPSPLPLPFQLQGIGVDHVQEPIRRPHGYPYHQWIQLKQGELDVTVADRQSTARAGDGLYLRPGEPHAYRSRAGACVVDWVCFDGSAVEDALGAGPLEQSGVFRLTSADAVSAVIAAVWAASPGTAPRRSTAVYAMLMTLLDEVAEPGRFSVTAGLGRLAPVLSAMAAHSTRPWTVDELADLIGVTPQHLGRLFRTALGQPPQAYLTRLRLNRARELLAQRPDLRVQEVGAEVGYPDANYFTRLFRRVEGRTPGEFRTLHYGGST